MKGIKFLILDVLILQEIKDKHSDTVLQDWTL